MNAVKYKYLAIAALGVAILSGCASPPISKEYREQAREITLNQVRADPEGTRGAVVIWGGRIINVVNGPEGGAIYIVCLPSPPGDKPIAEGPSPGRFIAASTGFLEPQMFPRGNLITVAGSLDGVRTEKLQNMQYPYPVLNIKEVHVWPSEPQYYSYPYAYYPYYGPYWSWGWWGPGPYWWGWGGYPVYYYGGFHNSFHGGFHGSVQGGFHGESHEGEEFHGGSESSGGFHGGGGGGGGFGGGFHGGGGGGGGHH